MLLAVLPVLLSTGADGACTSGEAKILVVNKPRPCVAADNNLSLLRYSSISVLTFGKVVSGSQIVAAPLTSSVCQTPVSVAIINLESLPG